MAPTDQPSDSRPEHGPASVDTGALLADIVARLRRAMRRAARAADPGNPLSVAQLEVLACVAEQPGARPGRIARQLMLAPNSVTTLVNALHARGLVARTNAAEDARAVALSLTPDGRRAVDEWKATNTEILQAALGMLDERHQRALTDALAGMRQLAHAVDALAEVPPRHGGPGGGGAVPPARRY
jgi:DNA-binding MarR family transcriptional regulator